MNHAITQHWDGETILLSYCIAVTGSYCTIQLMEQWRLQESQRGKLVLMIMSSVALGGCGIWCMHFSGMQALEMTVDDGTKLEVNFEAGMTILSLIFPIVGVFIGLKIGSSDPFFLEVEASRRKELLGEKLKKVKMEEMLKREAINRKIKYVALLSRLWHIAGGGFFAALGVLGMHYMGMMAQRTNATMTFNADIVALSTIIAYFTANAAFWILFRALTFWPNYESLRLGSALIMGIAVCGTHYSGMFAANYTFSEENYGHHTSKLFNGRRAANIASHASLFLCFWFSSFAVMTSLRKNMFASARSAKSAVHPEGARSIANNTTKAPFRTTIAQGQHGSKCSQGPSEGMVKQTSSFSPQIKDLEVIPSSPVAVPLKKAS